MSIEANESFGGKDYKFVTKETVFEMAKDGPVELDDGGDALLESLGHDPAARQEWRKSYDAKTDDFDTAKYWADYIEKYNYKPVNEDSDEGKNTVAKADTKRSSSRSGSTSGSGTKKTTSSSKKTSTTKRSPVASRASTEQTVEEKIEEADFELSDEIKVFIARLVREEVAKALKPLQEENTRLKKQVEKLEKELEEAKKAPPVADLDKNKVSEAEKEAMRLSGSPYRPGDKIKIQGQDGYHEIVSIPYKDEHGDWRRIVLVDGQPQFYKDDDLKAWNSATTTTARTPAGTPLAAPAPTIPPTAPAPPAAAPYTRPRRSWFRRREMTEEQYETYRRRGIRAGAIGAAALALVGGLWGIWLTAETEDIEATVHRIEDNQHKPIKKVIIENRTEKSDEGSSTTTTEQSTTTQSGSQGNNNTTTTTEQGSSGSKPTEVTPDNDEPLNGRNSYHGNFLQGGHGMAIEYPKNTSFHRNSDGTATITLRDGTTLNLHWRSSGRLTPGSVSDLEANGYDVGIAHGQFADREGNTYNHEYTVIGDRD